MPRKPSPAEPAAMRARPNGIAWVFGFDWIGCNEHHVSPYGLMPNPNLIAAAVIERTRTAGILQSGNIVPLTNSIRIAEEYAMLDVQSGGRLIAGFMRGIPHEYVAYNVAPDESYSRMREACELILKCWTEPEPFGWEGEHYRFRAVSIWPRPVQQPHPPLVMSGTSRESATLAAELGATMGVLRLTSFDEARATMEVYREVARSNGREPGPEHFMVGMGCCIADTREAAVETMKAGQKYFFEVLGGGIRTAQRLVIQKTRYFQHEESRQKFPGLPSKIKQVPIEERIEKGLLLCGTPDMAIDRPRAHEPQYQDRQHPGRCGDDDHASPQGNRISRGSGPVSERPASCSEREGVPG